MHPHTHTPAAPIANVCLCWQSVADTSVPYVIDIDHHSSANGSAQGKSFFLYDLFVSFQQFTPKENQRLENREYVNRVR